MNNEEKRCYWCGLPEDVGEFEPFVSHLHDGEYRSFHVWCYNNATRIDRSIENVNAMIQDMEELKQLIEKLMRKYE